MKLLMFSVLRNTYIFINTGLWGLYLMSENKETLGHILTDFSNVNYSLLWREISSKSQPAKVVLVMSYTELSRTFL
jgi:hypothetical protein